MQITRELITFEGHILILALKVFLKTEVCINKCQMWLHNILQFRTI